MKLQTKWAFPPAAIEYLSESIIPWYIKTTLFSLLVVIQGRTQFNSMSNGSNVATVNTDNASVVELRGTRRWSLIQLVNGSSEW